MANYLLAYTGGGMAATEVEREQAMATWGQWFGALGPAIVDAGNPFGPSASVDPNGANGAAETGLTGYSILTADSLDAAARAGERLPRVRERRESRHLRGDPDRDVATSPARTGVGGRPSARDRGGRPPWESDLAVHPGGSDLAVHLTRAPALATIR